MMGRIYPYLSHFLARCRAALSSLAEPVSFGLTPLEWLPCINALKIQVGRCHS